MLGELHQAGTDRALDTLAMRPPEPAQPPKPSFWGGLLGAVRLQPPGLVGEPGVQAGAAEMAAGGVELGVGLYRRLTGPQDFDTRNPVSERLREFSTRLRPDPATAGLAERVTYDLERVLTKAGAYTAAAGPVGAAALLSVDEALTVSADLRGKVDETTRSKVAAVTGLATGIGTLLPVFGGTVARTLGLYALGGPGAFVAQQAATREILRSADYGALAAQYDPLDPYGLPLAFLLPTPFVAAGLRANLRGAPGRVEPTLTAEQTDAVMAHNLTLMRDVHEATPPAVMAAEMMRGPVTGNANFRAWFGASKVVDEQGAPLVVYHGTSRDFDAFDTAAQRSIQADSSAAGLYFTRHPEDASGYATGRTGREGANVVPVYVSLKNPFIWPADDISPSLITAAKRAELEAKGYDGIIYRGGDEIVAFRPEQVKSAIGNSGLFDPASGSLTDAPDQTEGVQTGAADVSAVPLPAKAPGGPAAGVVRMYHGGEPGDATGPLWFTSDLRNAKGWAKSSRIWYVDVPKGHAALGGDPEFGVLPPQNIELPADIAVRRQVLDAKPGLLSALETAAALLKGRDPAQVLAELQAKGDVPPLLNNAIVAMVEAGGRPARLAATVAHFEAAAKAAPDRPAADLLADAVERVRAGEPVPDDKPQAKGGVEGDALLESLRARVALVETTAPEMIVRRDETGTATAADELARARKEAAEGTADELGAADADLVRIAADCMLSTGGR